MGNSKNDDMGRSGDKNSPQSRTPQNTPQGRDTTNRERDFEEGRNITNQGWTGTESFNRDSEKNRDSENRDDETE